MRPAAPGRHSYRTLHLSLGRAPPALPSRHKTCHQEEGTHIRSRLRPASTESPTASTQIGIPAWENNPNPSWEGRPAPAPPCSGAWGTPLPCSPLPAGPAGRRSRGGLHAWRPPHARRCPAAPGAHAARPPPRGAPDDPPPLVSQLDEGGGGGSGAGVNETFVTSAGVIEDVEEGDARVRAARAGARGLPAPRLRPCAACGRALHAAVRCMQRSPVTPVPHSSTSIPTHPLPPPV
jgi:hypothetical protein